MLSEKAIIMLCKNCICQEARGMLKSDAVSIVTNINSIGDLSGNIMIESVQFSHDNIGIIQKYICTLEEDDEAGVNVSLTKFKNDLQ